MLVRWIGILASLGGWLGLSGGAFAHGLPIAERDPSIPLSSTANGDSGGAEWVGNGRFLLFLSTADTLVTNCHNGPVVDLFLRDTTTGIVSLISATPDNRDGGNAGTFQGAMSDDGRFVVFESQASNLTAGDTDEAIDYFLRDLESKTTLRISSPAQSAVAPHNDHALRTTPAIAPDGSRAAYVRGGQLYVYERATGLVTLVTRPWNGGPFPTPGQASQPRFSRDGRRLAFQSTATTLVPPVSGAVRPLQLFVLDFASGGIHPTNLSQLRITNSQLPIVTGGYPVGDFAFTTDSRQLTVAFAPVSGSPSTAYGVRRFDLTTGTNESLSSTLTLSPGSTLTLVEALESPHFALQVQQGSGVTTLSNGLFVWSPERGLELQTVLVAGQPRPLVATPRQWSSDGTRLLFSSIETNLTPVIPDARMRHYVQNIMTGTTVLAVPDDNEPLDAVLSPDGTQLILESAVSTLVPDDRNDAADLFRIPVGGGEATLLTPRVVQETPRSGRGTTVLEETGFSANGQRVAFSSTADDLDAGDVNVAGDVFVRDLPNGVLRRVSVDREGGPGANGHSGQPRISADGRYVAFISGATNLVSNDSNSLPDLFRRDLETGETILVSRRADGSSGVGSVVEFAMDRTAQRFVFQARDTDLTGTRLNGDRIYLRDLPGDAVAVLSTTAGGSVPVLSNDGSVAAFVQGSKGEIFTGILEPLQEIVPADSLATVTGWLLNADGSRPVLLNSRGNPEFLRRDALGTYFKEILPAEASAKRKVMDAVLSSDGLWLAYSAAILEPNPLLQSGRLGFDIYLRNRITGVEISLSHSYLGGAANGDSDRPSLSSDGRYIAFRSRASDLVSDDDNRRMDVFVHDRLTGITRLVTRDPSSSTPWAGGSHRGLFGAGAEQVWVFTSEARAFSGDWNSAPDMVGLSLRVDTDADGLDDDWERVEFGNLDQDGSGDFDQDSLSNAQEAAAGTSPKDGLSGLQVKLDPASVESVTLSWPAVTGKRYRVVMSYGFPASGAAEWERASDVLTATGPSLSFETVFSPADFERYFSLVVAE